MSADPKKVLHIIELRAENFKRLKAVAIKLGNVNVIKGRNKQGKSTIGDVITAVLGGARAVPEKPLRKGQDSGFAELILGRDGKPVLKATRIFNAEGHGQPTALRLENPEGGSLKSPQAVLDALRGVLIDPQAFMELDDDEQLKIVRQLIPGVDFDAIDALNRGDHERRQDVNRDLKSVNAQLAAIKIPGDPRQTRVDEAALVAELESAGKVATDVERERARRLDLMRAVRSKAQEGEQYARLAQESLDRIVALQAEIARLDAHARECAQKSADAAASALEQQQAAEALPPLALAPDTADITKRLTEARQRNREVDDRDRAIQQRETLAQRAELLAEQSQRFTDAIAKRKQGIADAVAKANLPVKGLTFDESKVLLNDLPLSQASASEQIDTFMRIGVALSPEIRVAFIKEASLLDADTERQILETAAEFDLEVILEKVANENDGVGIYIEDGMVKAADAEVAA